MKIIKHPFLQIVAIQIILTIIFVTHNPEIAQYSSRNIMLRDGKIREDVLNDNILSAAEALAALPKPQDE